MNRRFFSLASKKKLYTIALWLAVSTIAYNLIEGILATFLGFEDETLALFGFGLDSFIEMISGFGVLYMVLRVRQSGNLEKSKFEVIALKITGYSFYALAVLLILGSVINFITGHQPETTLWGVIISLVSIIIMLVLIYAKGHVGRQLDSPAIIADANCAKVCVYMSFILLLSSGIYELTGFVYADSMGALGLAWFSLREGKECFQNIKSISCCS